MKIFLDANILFSAAYREGTTSRALVLLFELADCEILTSRYAMEEAYRNLIAKAPSRIDNLDRLMRLCTTVREPDTQQLIQARSELSDPTAVP